MKNKIFSAWAEITFCLLSLTTKAQDTTTTSGVFIEPGLLEVAYNKTTNLIFPYAIKSVDKGTQDILMQKAIGVENVLQLKAAKPGFDETNLTVVTADGSLFSYLLHYAENPLVINIRAAGQSGPSSPLAVFTADATTDEVQKNAATVAVKKRNCFSIGDAGNGIGFDLKGLYVDDGVFYFQLKLDNDSKLDYNIKMLRFFIHDKRRSRRTASQEITVDPLYLSGNTTFIGNHSEHTLVVAVPLFTIPDKKRFELQLMEANGGRHMKFHISNKWLMKAHTIH